MTTLAQETVHGLLIPAWRGEQSQVEDAEATSQE